MKDTFKIHDMTVHVNEEGMVTHAYNSDPYDCRRYYPFKYDRKYGNFYNVSGWYTPKQLRYHIDADCIQWA